jgi:hypothetical protein
MDEQLELINRQFSTSNAAYAQSCEESPNSAALVSLLSGHLVLDVQYARTSTVAAKVVKSRRYSLDVLKTELTSPQNTNEAKLILALYRAQPK